MLERAIKKYSKKEGGRFQRVIASFKNAISVQNEMLLLGAFYALMHGGILLMPHAVFWDDWVLYRSSPSVILDKFSQAGAMFDLTGYLHVAMLSIGIWSYKVLTFILMFVSGILLELILKRNAFLTKESRFYVVLLFLVLPFYMARVAMIDFPYTFRYFLFFLAWLLLDKHKIISIALFFLSFNTNSLLVFYALPILDAMYRGGYLLNVKTIIYFIRRYVDFLLLPFLFYLIKIEFFKPFGLYAGYNEHYNVRHIPDIIKEQILDLVNLRVNPYVFTLAVLFVFFVLQKKIAKNKSYQNVDRWPLKTLLIGILATVLGAFPYWIIGNVPLFNDWDSRNQLLLPLGASLGIVGVLFSLNKYIRNIGLVIVISGSLSYGMMGYYSFFKDWNKQTAIIDFFSKNPIIRDSSLVIIKDETTDLNALHRKYRFYEWNGLLEMAYGNQRHFAIQPDEITYYRQGGFDKLFSLHYKAGDHKRSETASAVVVDITHKRIFPRKNGTLDSSSSAGLSGLAFSVSAISFWKSSGNSVIPIGK